MNTIKLINAIFQYVVEEGVTKSAIDGWDHTLTHNGMEIVCRSIDEGYTHVVYVKGLVRVSIFNHETPSEQVSFSQGDEKALLTIARMFGLTIDGELI